MSNSCSNTLTSEKLPVVVSKMEHFLFQAMKEENVSFFQIAQNPGAHIGKLMDSARRLIDKHVLDYIKKSKSYSDRGEQDVADQYNIFATNLQTITSNWQQAMVNTLVYSRVFGVKTKFIIDEKTGLVDLEASLKKAQAADKTNKKYNVDEKGEATGLEDMLDDETVLYKKFIFDQSTNEIDPFETIDKAVEIFIRSIPREDAAYDDYGFTVGIDYSSFVRTMMADLENALSIDQIIKELTNNLDRTPEYKHIIDMLTFKDEDTAVTVQLKINFRNSFAKAQIPIFMTSIEDDVIKTFEASVAKRSKYEKNLKTNFSLMGGKVKIGDKEINLAHQENGRWVYTKEDVGKIQQFLDENKVPAGEMPARKIAFLEALGFTFSPNAKDVLLQTINNNNSFKYLLTHFLNILNNPNRKGQVAVITDPLAYLKLNWDTGVELTYGQNNTINDLISLAVKYDPSYNIERSVITPEGTRAHTSQLHNNFTIIAKFLNDYENYPTLQSIIDAEPSLAYLNPATNPTIKNSLFLNSLFFLDEPNFPRKYYNPNTKKWDKQTGLPVQIFISSTGGLQKKEGGFKSEGSSTTSLEEGDKLLKDLYDFKRAGFSSVPRLGDKSTDLSIRLNYYHNFNTNSPSAKYILVDSKTISGYKGRIFTDEKFINSIIAGLKDYFAVRHLALNGFYSDLNFASENALKSYGELNGIMNKLKSIDSETYNLINSALENNLDGVIELLDKDPDIRGLFNQAIVDYFEEYYKKFDKKLQPHKTKEVREVTGEPFVKLYLASSFLTDLETMKLFFGYAIHFKDFHKRASKDSATGTFTLVEPELLNKLNDRQNAQGLGVNTNLSSRLLLERLLQQGKITKEQFDIGMSKTNLTKEFKSAVIKEVKFKSPYAKIIVDNVEDLYKQGKISNETYNLFKNNIKKVIEDKYNGDEADGQGKCTFDFYRTMSILTNNWTQEQEISYKKIVEYAHYDELASQEENPDKKLEYIQKRDAVGYSNIEQVYFPPKKFQYAGPQKHERIIDGQLYNALIPEFDKFSLQPLIPTIIKGTEDEELAKRMEYEGVSYVKMESASKAERPNKSKQDSLYEEYDENKPNERKIKTFEQRLSESTTAFNSEQSLYYLHLKEQLKIDAEVHDEVIFGSQARKLIMMNLLSIGTNHNRQEFERLYNQYKGLIDDLVQIEKTTIYDKLGITQNPDGTISLSNMKKLAEYFRDQVARKNQDTNVRKALELDKDGVNFKIPLDGSVQAQIVEGILISSINNNIVKYKSSGSMLTQVSITGSGKKFSKAASEEALNTFGNTELKYYDLQRNAAGKITGVSAMQVKVGFTKQWAPLLNLTHFDGNKIGSLERLNEALKNEEWMNINRRSVRMISYRIPTQGRNFLDVMEVAEFLPSHFGDAVIMPSEIVIKNGGDFDIDKMFVFYPNMSEKTGKYDEADYVKQDLKRLDAKDFKSSIQNKIFETMAEIILHPNNYLELLTPSDNYHINPVINAIYEKLGLKEKGEKRPSTDFKNEETIEKTKNIEKFLSLLKGKKDLGIAAIANTFNVLFQLSEAVGNPSYFEAKKMKTFFSSKFVKKNSDGLIENVSFGNIYDEDGMLKSEFFSEFINAFVDVAKDDYVFVVNVVTEFSPMIFYMKFAGYSTNKILSFINQPILRDYIKNLSRHDGMFMQNTYDKEIADLKKELDRYIIEITEDGFAVYQQVPRVDEIIARLEYLESSSRKKALIDVVQQYGFLQDFMKDGKKLSIDRYSILKYLEKLKINPEFTDKNLFNSIENVNETPKRTVQQRFFQLAVLAEMLSQKEQSDSLTEAQRFLNFDTNPYESGFDVYLRNKNYQDALNNVTPNVLSPETIRRIKKESIISPLDVSNEVALILKKVLPLRNSIDLNKFLLNTVIALRNNRSNKNITGNDDMLKYVRTAKNDFLNYILQNYFENSEKGVQFFRENFNTTKSLNEYLKELVTTDKLRNQMIAIRNLDIYPDLIKYFPLLQNIAIDISEKNGVTNFKILEDGNNVLDKQSVINQFEALSNLQDEDLKPVRDFIRDLSLFSIYQSGYNSSDISYTGVTPIDLINPLYAFAVEEFEKTTPAERPAIFKDFIGQFNQNNVQFFTGKKNADSITKEAHKKGKWYSKQTKIDLKVITPTPQTKTTVKTANTTQRVNINKDVVESVKMGTKKWYISAYKIDTGNYTALDKSDQVLNLQIVYAKEVGVNDLNSDEKRKSFAEAEGFESWDEYVKSVEAGTDETRKKFLNGEVKRHLYQLKYLPVGGASVTVPSYYSGKFIYSTPGSGKTTLAREASNVIDTDDLIVREMNNRHPDFKQEQGEKIQDFIYRYVKTYDHKGEINNIVLGQIRNYLAEGQTVLTGTVAFIKEVDFVFRMNPESKQAIERFGSVEKAKEFAQVEKDLVAKAGKTAVETKRIGETLAEQGQPSTSVGNVDANKNIKKINLLKLFMINHKESKVLTVGDRVEVYFNKSDSTSILTIKSIKKTNNMFKIELSNNSGKTYTYTVDRLGKGATMEIEPDNKLLVFEKDLAAFNTASTEFKKLTDEKQAFIQGKIPEPTISNSEKYTIARPVEGGVSEKIEDEGYKLTFDGHPNAIFYLKVHRFVNNEPGGWLVENVNTGYRASDLKDTAEEAYKDFMTKLTGSVENINMSDEKNVKVINTAGFDIEKLKPSTSLETITPTSVSDKKADIEVVSENYSPELLKANPNKLFLFGDNNQRTGKGGQAIIRDEPNAIGISTKLLPKNTPEAFMSDDQLADNKAVIDSDIKKAKEKAAKEGKTIVLPKGGFGTGLAALATKAPQTFAYLNQRLQEEFGFDNTTGEIITKEVYEQFSDKEFYELFSEEIEKSEEESRERFGEYLDKINAFREMMRLDMTDEDIDKMYETQKLSGETIEEFLHRMSCLGKLK